MANYQIFACNKEQNVRDLITEVPQFLTTSQALRFVTQHLSKLVQSKRLISENGQPYDRVELQLGVSVIKTYPEQEGES